VPDGEWQWMVMGGPFITGIIHGAAKVGTVGPVIPLTLRMWAV